MLKLNEDLYNYPVTITSDDFVEYTGIDIAEELNSTQDIEAQDFLTMAHENVYNLIYKVGGQKFKNRLIKSALYDEEVGDDLKKLLKRCLCSQLKYMLDANGDYGSTDGSNTTPDGQLVLTNRKELTDKIVAPKVYEILKSFVPNLIWGVKRK